MRSISAKLSSTSNISTGLPNSCVTIVSSFGGDSEPKCGTVSGLRFHPNPSAVPFYDFLADRKADTRSRIFMAQMEAFKDVKDLFPIFLGQPNAVIADRE